MRSHNELIKANMSVIISSSKAFFNYCQEFERYKNRPVYLSQEIQKYAYLLGDDVDVIFKLDDISSSAEITFLDFVWLNEEMQLFFSKSYKSTKFHLHIYDDLYKTIMELSSTINLLIRIYHLKYKPTLLFSQKIEFVRYQGKYLLRVKLENFTNVHYIRKRKKMSEFSTKIQKKVLSCLDVNSDDVINIVLDNKISDKNKVDNFLQKISQQMSEGGNWFVKPHPNPNYNQLVKNLNIKTINIDVPSEFFVDLPTVNLLSIEGLGDQF